MASLDKKEEPAVKIADLCFYFDAMERDRMDQGQLGRKAAEILALRHKLLTLPPAQFDQVMSVITKLVEECYRAQDTQSAQDRAQAKRSARELYERANDVVAAKSNVDSVHKI